VQGQDAEHQVLTFVGEQVSPALARQVREILSHVQDRSAVGGPLGALGVLIAAIAGFTQFERAFDHMWDVPTPDERGLLAMLRHTLIERGVAFLMLVGVALLIVIVFVASMVIAALDAFFTERLGFHAIPGPSLRVFATIMLNTCLFMLLYRYLPPAKVRWDEALRAGLLAAGGWELGRIILSAYVIGTRYTSAYGLVGSFLAVQLWCYYAVAVILFSGEYLKEICSECTPRATGPASQAQAAHHKDILHSADAEGASRRL
jgi:membrane protein